MESVTDSVKKYYDSQGYDTTKPELTDEVHKFEATSDLRMTYYKFNARKDDHTFRITVDEHQGDSATYVRVRVDGWGQYLHKKLKLVL